MNVFCSVIIPTIGRNTLARAVHSVLDQAFDAAAVEVIVINDSGQPLPPEPWQRSERVRILHTQQRERSVARNTGAATAQGAYLCFLDDDDWLLPGALATFWELAQREPEAAWLYGGIQVVGSGGQVLAERNSGLQGYCLAQIMGGAWVPIQSSLVRAAEFFAVGGYNPFIRGTEDQDLCRRIAARGALANTPLPVACLFRGDQWHTSTDYGRAAEDTRHSRDAVVAEPGALRRMLASAGSSYWHGRIAHVYLSLARWQWRRRPLTAASRALHGLIALLLAAPHWFRQEFWQALRADHVPGSLHFVQMVGEEEG